MDGTTILDQGGYDVMTATLKDDLTNTTTIKDVEKITFEWDKIGSATFDVENISGAEEIILEHISSGTRNATVNETGENNITAGSGMTGTLTVNAATDTIVDGGYAGTVNVEGTGTNEDDLSATVTAGDNTSTINVGTGANGFQVVDITGSDGTDDISVDNSENITIQAGAATTIAATAVDMDTGDDQVINITAGSSTETINATNYEEATIDATEAAEDATITLDDEGVDAEATVMIGSDALVATGGNVAGSLTFDIADQATVDVTGALGEDLTITGTGDVEVLFNNDNLDDQTVINDKEDGTLTVETDQAGVALDLEDVDADLIRLTGVVNETVTAVSGSNFEVTADLNDGVFVVDDDTENDEITVTFKEDQTDGSTTFTNFNTVNIVADSEDLTFAELNASSATGDDIILLSGSENVEITVFNQGDEINASDLDGELTVTDTSTSGDITITGAQGKNDVTFENDLDAEIIYVGGDAGDEIDFQAPHQNAQIFVELGEGDDEVEADIGAMDHADAYFILEARGGDNTIDLKASDIATQEAFLELTFTEGGYDTLKLGNNANIDDNDANTTVSFENLNEINVYEAGAADIAASALHGQDYVIRGDGFADSFLNVNLANGGDQADLSGLDMLDSASSGAALHIFGGDGDDTIVGSTENDVIRLNDGEDTVNIEAGGDNTIQIMNQAHGPNTITGFVAGDGEDELVFNTGEFGTINDTYNELQDGGTFTTNEFHVIDGTGYEDYDDMIEEMDGTGVGDDLMVAFYNTTTENVEIYFDSDSGTAGNESEMLVASFDDIDLAGIADFHENNFDFAAL